MTPLQTTCILLLALAPSSLAGDEADSDRDGLPDFHEIHKHGTNPRKADSDGDGTLDGDWLERREYAYTVRSVVQVMKPVTIEHLTDDFQDARVLDVGAYHVELEVVHYPFSTANEAIGSDDEWRRPPKVIRRWLEPGPTSDWTPEMRKELIARLERDGIEIRELGDREVVERVSAWLVEHAEHHDGFSSFITSFDDEGKPYITAELRPAAESGMAETGLSLEEQWRRELSARGMFSEGARGSCTSSAIYISGCLRAVGIPTRTVLCIPVIDASDEREHRLVELGIEHHRVRRIVSESARKAGRSWTSHTFNEVWVDGRWRRLNYARLGQGILDPEYLGLMTHVATFHDWADARTPETVGRRQGLRIEDDLFGGSNPYSTISLRDEFGVHCDLVNAPVEERALEVQELLWTDDDRLPADVLTNCEERGRFGLIARIEGLEGSSSLASFLASADLRVYLEAANHPRLGIGFDPGCWWFQSGTAYVYLPFGGADRRDLVAGVTYIARPRNDAEGYAWVMALEVER